MFEFKLTMEDIERLCDPKDAAYFKSLPDIEERLRNCEQPGDMGPVSEDDYKLAMIEDLLVRAGRKWL